MTQPEYILTLSCLDQRGIVDRFLAEGQTAQGLSFGGTPLNVGGLLLIALAMLSLGGHKPVLPRPGLTHERVRRARFGAF